MLGIAPGELDNAYALWLSRIHDEDRSKLADASRRLRSAEAGPHRHGVPLSAPAARETWLRHSALPRFRSSGSDEVWTIGGRRGRHREEAPRGTPAAAQRSARAGKRDAQGRGESGASLQGRSSAGARPLRRALVLADQVAATDSTALARRGDRDGQGAVPPTTSTTAAGAATGS